MLQQRIQKEYFPGDEPAKSAVRDMANPAARYADLTRRLAMGSFKSEAAKAPLLRDARELRGLIVARARSGGIVDHEMATFWEAVQAEASAKYRRKIEIYQLPTPAAPVAKPQIDPTERRLELLIIDREERWKRAGQLLAEARAKLAAHRAGKASA